MVWKPQCTLRYQNYLGWSIYQCYMTHGLNVLTYKAVKINSPQTEPLFAVDWPSIYRAVQEAEGQTPPPQEAEPQPPARVEFVTIYVNVEPYDAGYTWPAKHAAHTYAVGAEASVMVTQIQPGHAFSRWRIYDVDYYTMSVTFTVTGAGYATAIFDEGDGGDVFIDPSLAVDPLDGGTAASSYGPWTWGTSITVTATPNSGYRFDHWHRSQTGEDATGNPHTFTNLQSAENFTAVFVQIGDGGDGDGRPPSGCFIATACYGSPTHLRVCQLRAVKDTLVAKSKIALFFYHVYYVFSPAIALKIGNMQKTKATIRKTIEFAWRLIKR